MRRTYKDPRFAQANKEALFSLAAFGLYFIWWFVSAYGLGEGDPDQYSFVFGFPSWFFYSCILGFPIISLVVWAMVRFVFRDMSLESTPEQESGEED